MEKDTVLEIEFKEIWGKYAWRIVKNNIPFSINLLKVCNEEVKLVESSKDNIYIFNDFECIWDVLDNKMLIYEDDKIKIENFVKEINSKYGILKRWRAKNRETYYIINDIGYIISCTEDFTQTDSTYYNLGNYFKSPEEAIKFRDTVWKDLWIQRKEIYKD